MQRAALYLRSSKDRSDVSIDAQRRELLTFARGRKLSVVETFEDAVESGKNEHRPGFQQLITSLRAKGRQWSVILMLDTSRLARNQYVAHFFRHECKKRGVDVVFAKTPELDGVAGIIMPAVLHAMDEVHSFMSREKGLAGMAENVRQGWRAGGRAPTGYKLEHVETGTVRDGAPVLKSRLVLSDDAPRVAAYLKAKAAGAGRTQALRDAGLEVAATTAIGIEWNALTYAGHTVWNVRYETGEGGYVGGSKRRPRGEWVIQRDTHPALITDDEAEALIHTLETTSKNNARRTRADYLLSGLLRSPDGTAWHGDGEGFYRLGKGKRVKAADVEQAVLANLAESLRGPEFAAAFTTAAKAQADSRAKDADLPKLRREIADIERQIARLTGLLGQTSTPEPLLRQVETHEARRVALQEEVAQRAGAEAEAAKVRALTEAQVGRLLTALAEDMEALDREHLKEFIRGLLDKVELDTDAATFRLSYRLTAGDRLASPRVGYSIPGCFDGDRRRLRA